jgi:hypothetical protein
MKECPTCRTTYTDETLRFCLADGAPLIDAGEESTVVRQRGPSDQNARAMHDEPVRAGISRETPTPRYQRPPSGESGRLLKVILVILGLGILVVLIALVGTVVYYNLRPAPAVRVDADPKTPTASPAPTKDDSELREQIANLQKQLAEKTNGDHPPNTTVPAANIPSGQMTTTVRANSPGDGFLALRTLPSARFGDRVLKIPDGAALEIGACGPVEDSVHPGRWCQARYAGHTGYVYDYYVIYK